MTVLTWDNVCGNESVFWDSNMIWNTTTPHLPECFEKTVLVWIPFGLLWMLIPIEIHFLSKSKRLFIPLSLISTSKMIVNIVLVLLSIVEFSNILYLHSQGQTILELDIYNPVIKAMTFLLCIVFVHIERIQGIQSSSVFFTFWLILSITGICNYCTWISRSLDQTSMVSEAQFVVFMCYFPIFIGQGVLSTFNDVPPVIQPRHDKIKNACPRVQSPILSKLFFCWPNSLLCKGFKMQLLSKDVWNSDSDILCPAMITVFYEKCRDPDTKKRPSFQKILFLTHWGDLLTISILTLLSSLLVYTIPYLFSLFIQFLTSEDPLWHGWSYAVVIVLALLCSSLLHWHLQFLGWTMANAVQTATSSIVYQQAFSSRIHPASTLQWHRLVSVDSRQVGDGVAVCVGWVTLPLHVGLGVLVLYSHLGWFAFLGIGIIFLLEILTLYFVFQHKKLKVTLSKSRTNCRNVVDEIVKKIKLIKLLAWEKAFVDRMQQLRSKHRHLLWICNYLSCAKTLMSVFATYTAVFAIFAFHGFYDEWASLDPSKVYVAIIVFNILRRSMDCLPIMLDKSAEAMAAASRLDDFLMTPPQEVAEVLPDSSTGNVVEMVNASFSWDFADHQSPVLKNLNFGVAEKSLTAITGPPGSGKSSLLAAILGEMVRISGNSVTKGSIAFVSSTPWMQNGASIRDNITFGKPYETMTYGHILQKCHLEEELTQLPLGDATVVVEATGHRLGHHLEHKVSLARAVYSNSDVHLFDDIWKTFDIHDDDRRFIFESVIGPRGSLNDKTRVVVTSEVDHLAMADTVIVLQDGSISAMGSYTDLMQQNEALFDFLAEISGDLSKAKPDVQNGSCPASDPFTEVADSEEWSCVEDIEATTETRPTERMKCSTYSLYWKFFGIGFAVAVTILMVSMATSFFGLLLWPSTWSETVNTRSTSVQISVFGGWVLAYGTVLFLGSLAMISGTARASEAIHDAWFYRLLRSTLSGLEGIPSRDVAPAYATYSETTDTSIPRNLWGLCHLIVEIVAAVVAICFSVPIFTTLMVPIALIYILIQRYYIGTVGQLQLLQFSTKSPIRSHISETASGWSTLRAFGRQRAFENDFAKKLDSNLKHHYYSKVALSWAGVRLDLLGAVIVFLTATMGMVYIETLNPAVTGAVITSALIIYFQLVPLVKSCGRQRGDMILMKMLDYRLCVPLEAPWKEPMTTPEPEWPELGSIKYRKYFVTESPDAGQPIIANFTCTIAGGEKIGIVGLTKEEKKLMATSMYRIVEPIGGSVTIDGLDVSKLGLHDLRCRLTTISQDPCLFSGTIRFNMDPFRAKTDEEIWRALELADLKDLVSLLPNQLSFEIDPCGKNFRAQHLRIDEQLSMARAILHKTMIIIIVMDQLRIDNKFHDLIHQEFSNRTIIMIADSPIPVMDTDRVMVMDKGQIQEFDAPRKLLQDPQSMFFKKSQEDGNLAAASV